LSDEWAVSPTYQMTGRCSSHTIVWSDKPKV
jgi:hypothetical protein